MSILQKYKNFCIDLDGVMWNGKNSIPGSSEAVKLLCSLGKKVFFVTNNAALSEEDFSSKFQRLGLEPGTYNLYTTSIALIKYLKLNLPNLQKVAMIGMPGLKKKLIESGYEVVYPPDFGVSINDMQDFCSFDVDKDIKAVIIAFDLNFDYYSALYCCACIQNGADFIGINKDRYSIYNDNIVPASGCTLQFMQTATGKTATIIGKPMTFMFELIADEHNLTREETVMIGDSMESDILMGINANIDTILVLTGVTTLGNLENYSYRPSIVLESLGCINT
jgi:4-nitrophenyl phosphatase